MNKRNQDTILFNKQVKKIQNYKKHLGNLIKLIKIHQNKRKQRKWKQKKQFLLDSFFYFQIQKFNKALTFSNTYKHTNCQVTEEAKLVAEIEDERYCFCLCEQAIPKTGKIQFTFQILSGSEFFVGIGFRDIMQQNHYYDCYSGGYGTYLISEDGQSYSHDNEDVHNKQLSFKFTNSDIIIIEVSIKDKYIKWSKQNNPQETFAVNMKMIISNWEQIKILN
ncbi:unnamed protein product [Paramecium sonneborni]|uniref:Uncharacterized protein n=1 Tax=Paramecium sonneborni TaxID=65129 RepID=A0A8S1RQ56_9CILI|nr:unnamed protein product [Paramecium sonneborni]